jgi:hypothetical protein
MTLDFIYSCLVAASQILLIGWTGVLVAASIVTFRESPVTVVNTVRKQR